MKNSSNTKSWKDTLKKVTTKIKETAVIPRDSIWKKLWSFLKVQYIQFRNVCLLFLFVGPFILYYQGLKLSIVKTCKAMGNWTLTYQ